MRPGVLAELVAYNGPTDNIKDDDDDFLGRNGLLRNSRPDLNCGIEKDVISASSQVFCIAGFLFKAPCDLCQMW